MKATSYMIPLVVAAAGWWLLRKRSKEESGSEVLNNASEPLITPERDRIGLLTDKPVSLENIRKGVARGWYKAELLRKNGQPAVYLYGKDANGRNYGDTYPITEETYRALKAGVKSL